MTVIEYLLAGVAALILVSIPASRVSGRQRDKPGASSCQQATPDNSEVM